MLLAGRYDLRLHCIPSIERFKVMCDGFDDFLVVVRRKMSIDAPFQEETSYL